MKEVLQIKSLEFTEAETKNLMSEVKVLRKDDCDNKTTIDNLKQKIEELEKKQIIKRIIIKGTTSELPEFKKNPVVKPGKKLPTW